MGTLPKQNPYRFLFYWLPLIVWIVGIFLVSSIPSASFNELKTGGTLLHIAAFFVLFLLFYRLFQLNKRALLGGIIISSFIFTMVISISKECWQFFTPTREFSLKDILVDASAALLAMFIVKIRNVVLFGH